MMEYKGYMGRVTYDDDAEIFHGEVINTKTVITFQGKSVGELKREMKKSIDDYLSWCKEDGIEHEKPFSGKFIVRVDPDLHRKVVIESSRRNQSMNKFIEEVLKKEVGI